MRASRTGMMMFAMIVTATFLFPTVLEPASVQAQSTLERPDVTTFGVLWTATGGHNATLWNLRWSPDGSMIAAAFYDNMTVIYNAKDGTVKARMGVWVAGNGTGGSRSSNTSSRCDGGKDNPVDTSDYWPTRSLAWSPDGKYILLGNENGNIYIHKTLDWSLDSVFSAHTSGVLDMAFSNDGKFLASGSGIEKVNGTGSYPDNRVIIWNWEKRSVEKELTSAIGDAVMKVSWSPNGSMLAVASDDGGLSLWNTTTWERVGLLLGHTLGVLDVSWSPDGKRIVTGSRDYTMRIWDVGTQKLVQTLDDANCVRSVHWHAEGGLILEAGVQEVLVKVRDAGTGAIIQSFEESAASTGTIMAARWSPDGKTFATASGKERTVRLYGEGGVQGGGDDVEPGGPGPIPSAIIFVGAAVLFVVIVFIPVFRRMRRSSG